MTEPLETLISGEVTDPNGRTALPLSLCFAAHLPETALLPHISCLQLEMISKVVSWAIWGSYSVFLGFPKYRAVYIC